jgi:pSer/pThr/pTyr-binding forkhead associated (FHA) protein
MATMITTKLDFRLKNTNSGQEFRIDKVSSSIGRDPSCDIVLDQGYPSRTHAQIIFKNNILFVDDLMSTNGTFVNGQRIRHTTPIVPGDLIKFSTVEFSLLSSNFGSETSISKIPDFSRTDDSFIVQDEIRVDPNSTGVIQSYPLPFGWPVDNTMSKNIFQNEPNKKYANTIDHYIKTALSGDDTVYVAALIFNPSDTKPSIVGLSLESQQNTLSIGRSDKCTITFKAPSVSEHHANLLFKQNEWVLTDNNSTNGLRLNDKLVTELALKHNYTVLLGKIEMNFRNLPWVL